MIGGPQRPASGPPAAKREAAVPASEQSVLQGQRRTFRNAQPISALPLRADICVNLQSRSGNRTFVFCHRKPSKEFICELRKRIVARAHDYDAITTTG